MRKLKLKEIKQVKSKVIIYLKKNKRLNPANVAQELSIDPGNKRSLVPLKIRTHARLTLSPERVM